MISFPCPLCDKPLRVKDELTGKKIKCPACGQPVAVPVTAAGMATEGPSAAPRPPAPVPAGEINQTLELPHGRATDVGPEPVSSTDNTHAGATGKPSGYPPELTEFLAPAQAADEIGRLGPYRVLAVLGKGGMGVVFKAEDTGLLRLVALKAMLPGLAASGSAKQRFIREARAAAALKHPHIVTIFQVGEDRGAPFLAMEFLEGEPLDERLKRGGKLPTLEIVRVGREIALGLAAAHEKGLIHRDIKPANIWLEGKAGAPGAACHVKILDFGLARAMSEQANLTQGGIVGTPAYMAPEQARGKPVDHRCDLFSLGCVLYHMATGETPFKGTDTLAVLSALAADTPEPPTRLNADVPAGLSELVMKLLEKDPEKRPATARAVIDALAALGNERTVELPRPEPAVATRPSPAKAAPAGQGKPGRRGPAAALVAILLLGAGLGGWWLTHPGGSGNDTPSGPGEVTRGGPEQVNRGGPEPAGGAAWEPGPAEDMLPGLAARPAKIDGFRRWQIEPVALTSEPKCLAWSIDGKLLAVGMATGEIRLLDGGTLRPVRFLYGHEGSVTAVSWAKGDRLASAGVDKTIRLWEPDGTPGPVMRDADEVLAAAWNPDGTLLATGGKSGLVRLWQPDGTPLFALKGQDGWVNALAWSPDGRRLASVGGVGVRLWDADGKAGPVLQIPGEQYSTVAWSPDGARLVSLTINGMRLWDVNGKAAPGMISSAGVHFHAMISVAWSPDGRRIATGARDNTARLWEGPDFKPGPQLFMTRGPGLPASQVTSVSWSADSKRLATCSNDGTVRLWDTDGKPGPAQRRLSVAAAAWSPDGQRLASGGDDQLVRLWGADGKPGRVLAGHKGPVESVSWTGDGQRLASAGPADLRLWDGEGKEGPVVQGGRAFALWSPDGQVLLGGTIGGRHLWKPDGQPLSGLQGVPREFLPTWSPDSRHFASGDHERWEVRGREGKQEFNSPAPTTCVSWSPDGQYVARGLHNVFLHGSDGQLKSTLPEMKGHVVAVCWGPDSRQMALFTDKDPTAVQLWGIDGKAGPVLRGHFSPVRSLSWSRQGNRLASSGDDGTLRVYDTSTTQPLWTAAVFPSRRSAVLSIAGQVLHGYPANADEDFVYVAQTEADRFELYTPAEFQKKARKGGQHLPLFAPEAGPASPPVDDAWIKLVRQMPPAKQCEAVYARLRELNPGYFDRFEHKEANGRVVALTLVPDLALRDLSPLRALDHLEQLTLSGPEQGPRMPLADLKPLEGLKLTEFVCAGASVADLAPLAKMPLQKLTLRNLLVADLKPLRSLPLKSLTLRDTQVADLKPLQAVASLEELDVRGSPVTDLKPVQGMLLKVLGCDVEPKRDAAILKAMPTLVRINDLEAAAFFAKPAIGLAVEKWLQDLAALPPGKWAEAVAALPAQKQLAAVEARLFERNPGVDVPVLRHEIKDGAVVGIAVSHHLRNFAPLHALPRLRSLDIHAEAGPGSLPDLNFVKGMKLTRLACGGNRTLKDFTPLQGMPLTELECGETELRDLSVLKDLPLTRLEIYATPVTDLSPLRGMKLGWLDVYSTPVKDLSPLQGMPLTVLKCSETQVADLSPLRGMKLNSLDVSRTAVKDLSPLQGMPLTYLMCSDTRVTDLSVLRGMPLKGLMCDLKPERDAAILREIKTLERINQMPAAEFWKEVDAKKGKP